MPISVLESGNSVWYLLMLSCRALWRVFYVTICNICRTEHTYQLCLWGGRCYEVNTFSAEGTPASGLAICSGEGRGQFDWCYSPHCCSVFLAGRCEVFPLWTSPDPQLPIAYFTGHFFIDESFAKILLNGVVILPQLRSTLITHSTQGPNSLWIIRCRQ